MPTRSRRRAITYLEGYLWDPPHAKEAFRKAAKIAHDAGRKVALTLSDAFCVDRYRAEFLDLITTGTVDLVFANESELKQPLRDRRFRHRASRRCAATRKLAVVTRSEKGCVVVSSDEHRSRCRRRRSSAWSTPPARATCSRRASCSGSRAAAITRRAARLGALAAAEVIQHIGARPEVSLQGAGAARTGWRLTIT